MMEANQGGGNSSSDSRMRVSHWVDVRDRSKFLHRLMRELAGGALMSLEGDLSQCRFADELVASHDQTEVLRRSTSWPKQDFIVVKLEPEAVDSIFKQIIAAGLGRALIHVQIERNGVLELGAYDNFHRDCVLTGPAIDPAILRDMQVANTVRDFRIAPSPP